MATQVMEIFKKFRATDLLKEKKYHKIREKILSASARHNINFKTATKEELDLIRGSLERQRKRELANSIYTLIVSVLVTLVVYYIVSILFK